MAKRPSDGMVDIRDLKSLGDIPVPVRVRPRAVLFTAFILIILTRRSTQEVEEAPLLRE